MYDISIRKYCHTMGAIRRQKGLEAYNEKVKNRSSDNHESDIDVSEGVTANNKMTENKSVSRMVGYDGYA